MALNWAIPDLKLQHVEANGIRIHVASAGAGPALLLLHGWPHTWALWHRVMPALARTHRVIAPDLRGLGGSEKAAQGYDLHNLSDDAAALLDALNVDKADVAGIDLGAPVAWMTAMRHPARVRKLVVMEALLGNLPGAEGFLSKGPPWWFGFHGVPDLAETVLEGHEAAYLDWFYTNSTAGKRGIDAKARAAFIEAYSGRAGLRGGFLHYRAFGENNRQIGEMVAARRLTIPALAIGGGVVGEALYRQAKPYADDLASQLVADCGHIIPLEQPQALLEIVEPFLRG